TQIVTCFAEIGQFDKIVSYSKQCGYTPDYATLLERIIEMGPDKGEQFASQIANAEGGTISLLDIDRIADVFMAQNMVQHTLSFLLGALKDDRADQSIQQTRLLEISLLNAPQVADAILDSKMFSHYDRERTAA